MRAALNAFAYRQWFEFCCVTENKVADKVASVFVRHHTCHPHSVTKFRPATSESSIFFLALPRAAASITAVALAPLAAGRSGVVAVKSAAVVLPRQFGTSISDERSSLPGMLRSASTPMPARRNTLVEHYCTVDFGAVPDCIAGPFEAPMRPS